MNTNTFEMYSNTSVKTLHFSQKFLNIQAEITQIALRCWANVGAMSACCSVRHWLPTMA